MLGIPKIISAKRESVIKRLGVLLGPATLISVAYIDPGNFGSNIAAGSRYGLNLLWVVWVSGLLAIFYQYIAGKIGIASKESFLDLVKRELIRRGFLGLVVVRIYIFAMMIMILATDMAEFLGIVLGLSYILNLPIIIAMWLSIIDVFLLMTLTDKRGIVEAVIGFLVGVVGFSLIYELFIVGTDPGEVIVSSIIIRSVSPEELIIASSIIGSTIMPHALLLHTYLTADKTVAETDKKKLLRRHLRETIAYLSIASVINASIQILAYYAFFKNNYYDIDMDKAYILLTPLYGSMASLIFAISMMASGISSSMVSVMTGQRIFETWLGKKLSTWRIRGLIRLINMIPLAIALHIGLKPIDILVYSQVILSIVLVSVIIPIAIISAKERYMGEMRNSKLSNIVAVSGAVFIATINIWMIITTLGI